MLNLPLSLCVCITALLAPTVARDVPSAASFYVPSLPGLTVDSSRPMHIYAGHISSEPSIKPRPETDIGSHLFFFMIRATRLADKERIIFWFNGGPGCSSFDGLLLESGPLRSNGKGGLRVIEGGWNEYTTMVFIDQPAGTGLSYTSTDHYVHELDEAAAHVVQFLRNFYDVFPEFKKMETYLAGESYAGQYIPYIAQAILNSNLPTPLKGLALGNAWIDGRAQYPAYLDYAVHHGLIKEGTQDYNAAKEKLDMCMEKLNAHKGPAPPSVGFCEGIMTTVLRGFDKEIAGKKVCMNVYDVRLSDVWPDCGANWPPELPDIAKYLRRDDVIRSLHAADKPEAWVECNSKVGSQLKNKNSASSITLIPSLLEKMKVLLFSGDQDFICNHIGTEKLIANMHWNGAVGLADAPVLPWIVDSVNAGTWTSARNLSYVKVFNASHMVPYDAPQIAHDMMLRFMDIDFTQLASGSAKVPSKVGNDTKPALQPTENLSQATATAGASKTPEQDKAMWEAYYNAGSAALTLLLIGLAIGLFFFCRQRCRRVRASRVPIDDLEEATPLTHTRLADRALVDGYHDDNETVRVKRKGKEREGRSENMFQVGSDEEDTLGPRS